MWVDREGHYHIVSHNGDRGVNNLPANASGDCGRHFFSVPLPPPPPFRPPLSASLRAATGLA